MTIDQARYEHIKCKIAASGQNIGLLEPEKTRRQFLGDQEMRNYVQSSGWGWLSLVSSRPGPHAASCGLSASICEAGLRHDPEEASLKDPADDDTLLLTTYLVCAKQAFSPN